MQDHMFVDATDGHEDSAPTEDNDHMEGDFNPNSIQLATVVQATPKTL